MNVKVSPDRKSIIAELDPREPGFQKKKDAIKECPNGRRWDPDEKVWRIQPTLMNMNALSNIPEIESQVIDICRELVPGFFVKPDQNKKKNFACITTPFDHQKWLTSFLIDFPKGYLVFGGLGTGKTAIMAYLILNRFQEKRILMVVPNKVRPVWPRELKKHAGINGVTMKTGKDTKAKRKKKIAQSRIYVVNYENLRFDLEFILEKNFQVVILDESHNIRNPNTKKLDAILPITEKAEFVYCLTGTPRANTDADLFNQVKIVNPYIFGPSFFSFSTFWLHKVGGFDMKKKGENGKQYTVNTGKWELKPELTDYFEESLRATSVHVPENVLNLPPITYLERYVDMPDSAREIYNKIKQYLILEMEEKRQTLKNVLSRNTKLMQLVSGAVYGQEKEVVYSNRFKADLLIDIIENEMEPEKKCIVWFRHIHTIELAAKALKESGIRHLVVHGEIKENAASIVDRFRENKDIKILLTTDVLKEGLTITEATHAIFFDHGYSFVNRKQATHRIYRIGQDHPVFIIDLITSDTIEEKIMDVLRDKKDDLENLLDALTVEDI